MAVPKTSPHDTDLAEISETCRINPLVTVQRQHTHKTPHTTLWKNPFATALSREPMSQYSIGSRIWWVVECSERSFGIVFFLRECKKRRYHSA
jgi:hypothetical protein